MSTAPFILPATSPISNFDSQPPEPDLSEDQAPAPFADVMDAALARPIEQQPDNNGQSGNSAPTGKSKDRRNESKPASVASESSTDTDSSATDAPVSTDNPAQNDNSTVTGDTLAGVAASLMQPVMVITPTPVPVPTTTTANDGQAVTATTPVGVTSTKDQSSQAVNNLAGPTQTVVTQNENAGTATLPTSVVAATDGSEEPGESPDGSNLQGVAAAAAKAGNRNSIADTKQPPRDFQLPDSASPTAKAATSWLSQDPAQTGGETGGSSAKNPSEIVVQNAPVPRPDGSSGASGISAAQHTVPMNKMAETSKSMGLTEQNLPVNASGIAGEDLPVVEKRTFSARSDRTEPSALATASASSRISMPDAPAPVAATAATIASAPAMIDRTVQLIAQSAIQLRDVAPDSLQVVIKPGGDLQLSLDLHQRDGVVEVQATLQNGDFNFLKQHWSELQQQLESRGIRLSSLATEEHANNGNNPFQQQTPAQRDEDGKTDRRSGPLSFTTALAAPVIHTPVNRPGRGWESWA